MLLLLLLRQGDDKRGNRKLPRQSHSGVLYTGAFIVGAWTSTEGWEQKSLPTFSRSRTKKSAETFVPSHAGDKSHETPL